MSDTPIVFLFDLDETLVTYDPRPPGIFAAVCVDHGVEPGDDLLATFGEAIREHATAFHHDPFLAATRDLVSVHGLSVDPERFTRALLRAELDAMSVPDGVRETLAALSRDAPVAVVTGGHGPVQRRKVDRAGLSSSVDLLVSPVEARAFKPDTALLRLAARTLPGERYVVVGDSVDGDLEPALELGFETVLVGSEDGRATYTLDAPAEVPRLRDLFGSD
ncbi:HAD family hydrolase [Halomarina oriensis]|uniref:HAD hydrolase-like protein n=1 Tax=Halomarina oriensis TaxID=671145 RepID=A0A6B0GND6_9EURY|nr:HAD family hydrolase [Halomarina oriensis]MWG35097.1 HAD hydrolase-like protein [Halomarina oriensis]